MTDLNNLLKQLEQLSPFELSRINSAIHNILDDPERNNAIKRHLKIGMKISYFCEKLNSLVLATIVSIGNTRASVINEADGVKWNILLYTINLQNIDTNLSPKKTSSGLDRNTLKVGEHVGWHSKRAGEELYGTVEKLNPKTACIRLGTGEAWRVYYPSLFLVTDGVSSSSSGPLLIEGEVII